MARGSSSGKKWSRWNTAIRSSFGDKVDGVYEFRGLDEFFNKGTPQESMVTHQRQFRGRCTVCKDWITGPKKRSFIDADVAFAKAVDDHMSKKHASSR